ncbi:NlpC/P60 family protein [uncultured Roseobacter sp.]|uniref:C40 family peptidase n=1 Tax=uncultured Roseobacter sp. TaxID=114847 RepID=UPI00262BE7EC|nr:NlpC/P60 family protein [uncultured Roseobacter sp.]
MSRDRRETPDPAEITEETPAQICQPVADLCRSPGGPRDRQVLLGDAVTLLGQTSGVSLIRAVKDGYCGYVKSDALCPPSAATHSIIARATHAYSAPDIKSPERCSLTFGSRVTALSETPGFIETAQGFLPRQHLAPVDQVETDPAGIALRFLGTPYLWGGNTGWGIDCSGLVQAACHACHIPCPGDSDQQCARLGRTLPPGTPYQRNDLLFWKGHVAWVTDPATLLHANACHMAVAQEPIDSAIARITAQGDGPVTAHKRLA